MANTPTKKPSANGSGVRISSVRRGFEVDQSIGGWDGTLGGQSRAATEGFSETAALRNPYKQEPVVYSCTRRISDAASSTDLAWFESAKDDAKALGEDHPLRRLWADPNPLQTSQELIEFAAISLSLVGECFLFLTDEKNNPVASQSTDVRSLIEMPASIWPVFGGTRNVAADVDLETGKLKGWRVATGATQRTFPAASVVVLKYPDPERSYRGIGPLGAAFGVAVQSYFAQRYQSSLLRNGGEPGGFITLPPDVQLAPEERARLKLEIREGYHNPERSGETRLLEGGAKWEAAGFRPKDMAWGDLLQANRKLICYAMGVPETVLGGEAANYATFRGQLRVFWTITVLPLLNRVSRTVERRLVMRLRDPNMRAHCEPDLGAIEALQGDAVEQASAASTFFSIGVPLNQAIAMAGISADEIDGGDVGLVPAGLRPLVNLADEGESDDATADPQLALTGVQIDALVGIVEAVAQGRIPKATGVELIVAAFPLDRDRATAILADVEEGSLEPEDQAGGENSPAGGAGGMDDEDMGEDMDGKAAPPPTVAHVRAGQPTPTKDANEGPYATRAQREAVWRANQAKLDPIEGRLDRKLRGVFNRMRASQLQRLEAMAKGGKALSDRSATAQRTLGVSFASARMLVRAAAADRDAGADHVDVRDCTGQVIGHEWTPGPAVRRWLAARPRAAAAVAGDPRRAVDLARLAVAKISEADINQLIDALDAKWQDEIAEILMDAYERAERAADAHVLDQLGANFVATPDPAALRILRTKPIRVAEGIASTVAKHLRSSLIQVLAEANAVGSLQDQILAAFDGLAAETRRQFNMNARRARTIARTEVGQVSSVVRSERIHEAAEQGIVTSKVWITAVPASAAPPYEEGGYVRFQHWSMDGKTTDAKGSWLMPDGTVLPAPKWPGGPAGQVINCYLPGTLVEGRFVAGSEARYSGPAREIETARGVRLRVTPNHPVLTTRGWIAAGDLREGDHLLRCGVDIELGAQRHVHDEYAPAAIEDVFHALAADGRQRLAVVRARDFHGDAVHFAAEVDGERPDRHLLIEAGETRELVLIGADAQPAFRERRGAEFSRRERVGLPSARAPGGCALADDGGPVVLLARPLQPFSVGPTANWNASTTKADLERLAIDAELGGNRFARCAAQVALDRVVQVREFEFSGHVYDLQTVTGWMVAQGVVSSNCRCDEQPELNPDALT